MCIRKNLVVSSQIYKVLKTVREPIHTYLFSDNPLYPSHYHQRYIFTFLLNRVIVTRSLGTVPCPTKNNTQ